MTNRRAFGVGCFHFGIKRKPPFKFKVSEYIGEVKLFLQSIPNIDTIEIESGGDNEELIEVEYPISHFNIDTFPLINFLSIHFNIMIPIHIQRDITDDIFTFPETGSVERFKVSLLHAYYCPVAFIEPLDVISQSYDPTNAIIVVREFLLRHNIKRKPGFIEFQVLGPSPFHVEFFVEEPEPDEIEAPWFFWYEKLDMKGYDHLTFYYDRDQFEDIDSAKLFIIDEIKDEVSFFYRLIQIEREKSDTWHEIWNKFDDIIEIQKSKGIRGITKRYRSFRELNEVFLSIIQFQSGVISQNESTQSDYRDI